ncbi:MAG TPA: shikimate dehydrogenase [Novosphingobium sp.]|nr:shikimate dehydrogenase [Novosphingobium sp.]HZV09039.1 shikimate dehydrogenase [Novosphingobium sp.]
MSTDAQLAWHALPPLARACAEVIGDPIAQSKSPLIHRFWLARLGLAADYRHAHVLAGDVPAYIAARRADPLWRGCNITMPHKQAVMPLLDRIDPLAARIGAVNTVVRGEDGELSGFNTDAPGFMEPLAGLSGRALVLGAGGAARAIVLALADAGFALTLAARDAAKAAAVLAELAPGGPHQPAPLAAFAQGGAGAFDLVVNASPLGMVGQPALAFDLAHLRPGGTVYDIVTAPAVTPLLAAARARGLATVDGLAMLIGQADYAFRRFYGARPDRADGDAALRALLAGAR